MSEQPQFRPRVLPMPKAGDILVVPTLRGNEVCVVEHVETDLFVTSYGTFRLDWKQDWYPRWNWQDPAVEAQRLMEAAYRADTRPFPESLLEAIEMASEEGDVEADNVLAILIEQHPATIVFALVPHLLRWQAQQEGGKP